MTRIKLTPAQISALECSGVIERTDATDSLVDDVWDALDAMHFADSQREDLGAALIELANSEDALAQDRSRDQAERQGARGAALALGNLASKILKNSA